jgi:Domain of unknown function (DUF4164)
MPDQNAIEQATTRFAVAIGALETAVDHRIDRDRDQASLTDQLQAADTDRSRLAAELDAQLARSRQLEMTNRDIARRIDAAMEHIRLVLESQR